MAELELGDHFHHLKRTSVLLSTALIITFVPGVESGDAAVVGFSLAKVDRDFVRFLIWTAASYYTGGFILEFLAERRRNSLLTESGGVAAVEKALTDLASRLSARWLHPDGDSLSLHPDEQLSYRLNRIEDLHQRLRSLGMSDESAVLEGISERVRSSFRDLAMRIKPPPPTNELLEAVNQVIPELKREKRAIRALREGVTRSVRFQFYWWERGGALIPYLLGSAVWAGELFRRYSPIMLG